MSHDLETVLRDIDTLWDKFKQCRAHFPCVSKTMVGQKCVPTAPYYVAQGFQITYVLNQELTLEMVDQLNEIGHWLNQNFVFRLYAILDYHNVVNSIEQDIDGWKYVNVLRWLRRYFSHQSGHFDENEKEHQTTMQEINDLLGVNVDGHEDFPLPIDKVLHPLMEGCKRFVVNKYQVIE